VSPSIPVNEEVSGIPAGEDNPTSAWRPVWVTPQPGTAPQLANPTAPVGANDVKAELITAVHDPLPIGRVRGIESVVIEAPQLVTGRINVVKRDVEDVPAWWRVNRVCERDPSVTPREGCLHRRRAAQHGTDANERES
jgi:hypothetical protein